MIAIVVLCCAMFLLSVGLAVGIIMYRVRSVRQAQKLESLRSGVVLILSDFLSSPFSLAETTPAEYRNFLNNTKHALIAAAGAASGETENLSSPNMQEIKNSIIEFMDVVSGETRGRLEELYASCGFADAAVQELASSAWWKRSNAATELGTARLYYALNLLCDHLADPNPSVSLQAMHAALDIGGAQMIPRIVHLLPRITATEEMYMIDVCIEQKIEHAELLLPLLEDAREDVKRFAIDALGSIHSTEYASSVIPFLHSPNRSLATAAMHSLGQMGGEQALEAIAQACESTDSDAKIQAAYALGAIGGTQSARILARLTADPNSGVRAAATRSLAGITRREERLSEEVFGVLRGSNQGFSA